MIRLKIISKKPVVFVILLGLLGTPAWAMSKLEYLRIQIESLPENPSPSPEFMDMNADLALTHFKKCRHEKTVVDFIDTLIYIFDEENARREQKDLLSTRIIARLEKLPQFQNLDQDPQRKKQFDELCFGLRMSFGYTRQGVYQVSCRNVVRMHFEDGATKANLREILTAFAATNK